MASILRTIRDFVQQAGSAAKTVDLPSFPMSNPMSIINIPLAIGGAVAALVVVSKYPVRREDALADTVRRKSSAFFVTGLPGVIIAQVAYDVASHHMPYLSKIPSLSLGVGLILGGCGLPIFLALREKLPEALTNGLLGWVQAKLQNKDTKKSTAPSEEPQEPNQ